MTAEIHMNITSQQETFLAINRTEGCLSVCFWARHVRADAGSLCARSDLTVPVGLVLTYLLHAAQLYSELNRLKVEILPPKISTGAECQVGSHFLTFSLEKTLFRPTDRLRLKLWMGRELNQNSGKTSLHNPRAGSALVWISARPMLR